MIILNTDYTDCTNCYLLNPVNLWSTYRVAALKILRIFFQNYSNLLRRGQSPAEMPFLHCITFGRCPVVVRSLSSCCPVIDWTTTGQQLDNDRRRSCTLLVMNVCFSGENWGSRTDYMFDFTVRHTPPKRISVAAGCVAPSNIVNPGCVALSNWISDGSGQSVVLLRGRCAQNL